MAESVNISLTSLDLCDCTTDVAIIAQQCDIHADECDCMKSISGEGYNLGWWWFPLSVF